MRRVQLFEFLDQSWLPGRLRAALTRYLTATYATTPFPALWAAILARALDRCPSGGVVDLGTLAVEFLILGLDPYPRKPGAVFQAPQETAAGEGPFSALAALQKGRDAD